MSMALRPSYIDRTTSFGQFPCLMTTFESSSEKLQRRQHFFKLVAGQKILKFLTFQKPHLITLKPFQITSMAIRNFQKVFRVIYTDFFTFLNFDQYF